MSSKNGLAVYLVPLQENMDVRGENILVSDKVCSENFKL